MSGGSMNYIYCQIDEYAEMFQDPELIRLAKDFADLAHACEWMHSGDIGEGEYNKAVLYFKQKWFGDHNDRCEEIINSKVTQLKNELLAMIGRARFCKDCGFFNEQTNSDYGSCVNCKGYLTHAFDLACDKFEGEDDVN